MSNKMIKKVYLYKEYLKKFLNKSHMVFNKDIYIAVSGGADSIALLYLMKILNVEGLGQKLIALHVNHGTRDLCHEEEEMIRSFCSEYNIELRVKHLNLGKKKTKNFEMHARDLRYKFFCEHLGNEDKMMTAHHLDDSFEWSLMQQLKSSKFETTLGIPFIRGQIIRPFLCLTRAQIRGLIKEAKIPFMEDSSNKNTNYERNYLRHHIIPHLKLKYPKYLKHYAQRHNEIAKKLGVSVFGDFEKESKRQMKVIKNPNGLHIFYHPLYQNKFLGDLTLLVSSIEELSNISRGKVAKESKKLIEAFESSKKGPMNFSGAVKVYLFKGCLVVTSKEGQNYLETIDKETVILLEQQKSDYPETFFNMKDAHLHHLNQIKNSIELETFIKIGRISQKKKLKSLKSPSILFPKSTKWLGDHGIWHQNIFTCFGLLNTLDSLPSGH